MFKSFITLIYFILISNCIFSNNIDTVEIELKNSSMTLRKCKGFLFKKYIGNTFSYPPSHKITRQDSTFIYNKDTIFFKIVKQNRTIIEGKKLPEGEAIDTIQFYRNGSLFKKEFWVQCYYLDNKGEVTIHSKNAIYGSGDESTWIYKIILKKGKFKYSLIKTINENDDNKICFNVLKKTKNRTKKISSKCYFK